MQQDYSQLSSDDIEAVEKQTIRTIVQAVQEYSKEAKQIFDSTPPWAAVQSVGVTTPPPLVQTTAPVRRRSSSQSEEVVVLAEDLVQYALEVAECYPINRRFAGYIDYKRVRWLSTPFALLPQVLLVDAKASTEANRDTLQQSQLPMDAEFRKRVRGQPHGTGEVIRLSAGVPPHEVISTPNGHSLRAITTSVLVHFHYRDLNSRQAPFRELQSIAVLSLPHGTLKAKYNPDAVTTFFGEGKHSPARGEAPRIRVYFNRFSKMCPWRFQVLRYEQPSDFTTPIWADVGPDGQRVETPFLFIGR